MFSLWDFCLLDSVATFVTCDECCILVAMYYPFCYYFTLPELVVGHFWFEYECIRIVANSTPFVFFVLSFVSKFEVELGRYSQNNGKFQRRNWSVPIKGWSLLLGFCSSLYLSFNPNKAQLRVVRRSSNRWLNSIRL